MSAKTTYTCDCCGEEISQEQASLYTGFHVGGTAAASGVSGVWHACDAECASAHLRDVAEKVVAHEAKMKADAAAVAENRRAFAAATAPGAPPYKGEPPKP